MSKTKPYYAPGSLSAGLYDAVTAADRHLSGDEAIYAGLAPAGATILELGAGTGRLTIALARRGFQVTGIDIAPAMLAQAERAVAAEPPEVSARIELRRGDMTSLALGRRFDLVICPYFTLAHVPTGAAWRNTFAVATAHLAPGGRAAFHLPRHAAMAGQGKPDPKAPVMDVALPDGRRLVMFVRERAFKPAVNRLEQVLDYVLVDAAGKVAERSLERLTYYATDPTPYAAEVGLTPDRAPIPIGDIGDIHVFRN